MTDSRTLQLNQVSLNLIDVMGCHADRLSQRIVALANDGRSPSPHGSQLSRPSLAPEGGRVSSSSESGISYVSCDDWQSTPPPAYSPARPPHYSLTRHAGPPSPPSPSSPLSGPPQTIRREKSTSAFTRKLCGFFAPNETDDVLDNLVGDFIHPKKPKNRDSTNSLEPGSPLEIAVEVVQEEWTTGGRSGNNTRRASRFTFGPRNRNRDAEAALPSS